MIRALMTGMMGSSVPATIKVGCRISGNANRLLHTDAASSWWAYPTGEPVVSWESNRPLTIEASVRALPP